MQNKKPNINKEEKIFYDYFKNNLEDYELPVDEKCWEYVNQHISPKKKKSPSIIAFLSGVAAIALLVLIVVTVKDSPQEEQFIAGSTEIIVEDSTQHNTIKPNDQQDELVKIDNQKIEKKIQQSEKSTNTLLTHKTQEQAKENNEIQGADIIKENLVADEKKVVGTSDSIPQRKKIDNLNIYNESDIPLLAYNSKKSKKWELSASFGVSGSTSGTPNESFFNNTDIANVATERNSISDVEYAPPFSVGLLMRKRLNKTLSLETGLAYSYLSTTYKDIDKQHYSAKMRLHYVGIPLSLVTDIWNITPKLKLYASAGVMVEKGIKSKFSLYEYQTKRTITESKSIKGLQWSINASAGLSYKFYKGWNVYLEPHVSYYFDNNQPISIRTEKQTVISINSGFRYEF